MKIDNANFNEGLGRLFSADDYPTAAHTKTPANGALWSWLWFFSCENRTMELEIPAFRSMKYTGIKTRKEYRKALRDLEAFGLIRIVKLERTNWKDDKIQIT